MEMDETRTSKRRRAMNCNDSFSSTTPIFPVKTWSCCCIEELDQCCVITGGRRRKRKKKNKKVSSFSRQHHVHVVQGDNDKVMVLQGKEDNLKREKNLWNFNSNCDHDRDESSSRICNNSSNYFSNKILGVFLLFLVCKIRVVFDAVFKNRKEGFSQLWIQLLILFILLHPSPGMYV
jgi:hypothetical protein